MWVYLKVSWEVIFRPMCTFFWDDLVLNKYPFKWAGELYVYRA